MIAQDWALVRITDKGDDVYAIDPVDRKKPRAWGWRNGFDTGASAYAPDLATAKRLANEAFAKHAEFRPYVMPPVHTA